MIFRKNRGGRPARIIGMKPIPRVQQTIRHCGMLALWLALLLPTWAASGAQGLGVAALRDKHAGLAAKLVDNPFQGPLYLESTESDRELKGDVYALLEHPFPALSAALSDPGRWCDILILHLNTKFCRARSEGGARQLELRIGRKHDQPTAQAAPVWFTFNAVTVEPQYLDIELNAPDGPLDTHDYRILLEAIPITANRSFIHMRYAFAYGRAGRLAMRLYLSTIGRGKVGFTRTTAGSAAEPAFIGGVRGVVERNSMRYYLAIESYLDALPLPPADQLEKRLQSWFDGTQKYPRQLYEIERDDYLEMKRREYQRQQAGPLG